MYYHYAHSRILRNVCYKYVYVILFIVIIIFDKYLICVLTLVVYNLKKVLLPKVYDFRKEKELKRKQKYKCLKYKTALELLL